MIVWLAIDSYDNTILGVYDEQDGEEMAKEECEADWGSRAGKDAHWDGNDLVHTAYSTVVRRIEQREVYTR